MKKKKKMKLLNLKLWLSQKHKHLLVKFLVGFLLVGLAFRLLFVRSSDISSKLETPFPQETLLDDKAMDSEMPPPVSLEEAQEKNEEQIAHTGKVCL